MLGTKTKKPLKTFGIQTWDNINAARKKVKNKEKQNNTVPLKTHFARYKEQINKKKTIDSLVNKLLSEKNTLSKNNATKLAQQIYLDWLKDGTGPIDIDLLVNHVKWFNTPDVKKTKTTKRRNVEMPVNWSVNGVENDRLKENIQPKRKRQNCPSQMQVVIVAFERALDLLRKDLQTINVTLKELREYDHVRKTRSV